MSFVYTGFRSTANRCESIYQTSHGRGRWFETSIAHSDKFRTLQVEALKDDAGSGYSRSLVQQRVEVQRP
jgi:hypothetical protein